MGGTTNSIGEGVGGYPRVEASLLPWDKLTDDQKKAVLNCHRRVHQFASVEWRAGSGSRSPYDQFLPVIDPKPMNRVVLVNGSRGSGKTVVLLRLLKFWSDAVRGGEPAEIEHDFRSAVAAATDETSAQKIVPIANIGLQTLSESASLLPYIGAAFHQVLRGIEAAYEVNAPRGAPAWAAVEDSAMKCIPLWRDFMAAAAQWEGNLKEREKALDAEAYVLELRDAELQRLHLSAVFRTFLDALVGDFKTTFGTQTPPLFVIAIDDADMQPAHSVRVLTTIRLLEHHRVAYLLAGSTPLFLNMLSDWYMGRIRHPLTLLDLDSDRAAELVDREFATRLANDVLDKVMPRGHRFDLPPLPLERRYELMAKTFEEFDVDAEPLLGETSTPKRQFHYYLQRDPWTRNALPDRLRRIISFREYVEQGRSELPARRVVTLLLRMWRDVIDGSGLLPDIAEDLMRVLRADDFDPTRLVMETLRLNTSVYPRQVTPYREISDRFWFALRDLANYSIRFSRAAFSLPLNDEIGAVLILATDLIADDPNGDFIGPSLSPAGFEAPFGTISFDSDLAGQSIDFYWPLPNWDSFLDFHVFSSHWRQVIAHARGRLTIPNIEPTVAWLARWFIHLAVSISNTRTIDKVDGDPPEWSTLAADVHSLSGRPASRRRDRHVIDWARTRAVLLAAPESGLRREDADEWFNALTGTATSNARMRTYRRARFERAKAAIERSVSDEKLLRSRAEIDELLREIDETPNDPYEWSTKVGSPKPPSTRRRPSGSEDK